MTRWILALAFVLCVSAPLQAQTWTSVDYDSTPADNGANALTTCTIDTTNIAGEATGDLVVLVAWARSTTSTLAVTTAGGVTWTAYAQSTHVTLTSVSMRVWWATVDSDGFTGNLVVTDSGTSVNTVGCGVAVFHPSTGTVAEDVSLALDNDDAAPGSPFDVTVAAATTNTDNALAIALWVSGDDNSWTVQTAGWSNPTNMTGQTRNNDAQDSSLSLAYKAITPVGSTGTVSNRQSVITGDAAIHGMVVFKATGGGGGGGTPCVIGGGITRPGCPGEQQ
jgi:hypothetical protein